MPDLMEFFRVNEITPRKQQVEVLANLQENWSKYKYHICDCPTGVGKSFIALAAAYASHSAYLLTGTKSLQDQYLETSDLPVNIKGRGNFRCGANPTMKADQAPCTVISGLSKQCIARGCCIYHNQKMRALSAKLMLTNYAYFLYATHCGPLKETLRREVLIADEAHDLEKALISFAETTVSPEDLEREYGFRDISWRFNGNEKHDLEILESIFDRVDRECENYKSKIAGVYAKANIRMDDASAASKLKGADLDKIQKLSKKLYDLDKILQPLKLFYRYKDVDRWIIAGNREENKLMLSPLSAHGIFEAYMGEAADKYILMSATIGDPKVFCKELGIPMNEVNFIRVGTDFPAENSPIVYTPVGKMSYAEIGKTLPKIIKAVDQIMDMFPGEKGIIHSVNYRITEAIAKGLKSGNRSRLIHRDMHARFKMSNEDLVRAHEKTANPTVLLSPSLGVGTSLDEDLSRFQIIVKLPFMSLGDPRVKVKADEEPDWYLMRAFIEIMQCSGRSTRSKEDHSVTFILDSSFDWFYNKAKTRLPDWFIERIQK